MQPVNNAIYLRRRRKIVVPHCSGEPVPASYVAAFLKNIEPLGYTFSKALIQACQQLSAAEITGLYESLAPALEAQRGAHRQYRPMYPNFPAQVMEPSEAELYLNAIVHYLTDGQLYPLTEKRARFPLLDNVELTAIDIGSELEFQALFAQIAASNSSLSEQDKEDLAWFVRSYGDQIQELLPEAIPQRENMACVAGLLMAHTSSAVPFIARYCRSATDVLRVAVALSDGDVSLAEKTKYRSFSRRERRLLLALLNEQDNATEDMLRWMERWKRLGEKLHPGEYTADYPNAARAFEVLRRDLPFESFNSSVEQSLARRNIRAALERLHARPGDFARRLDHLLRLSPTDEQAEVVDAFAGVAEWVATPVLLQVRQHYAGRNAGGHLRIFFPKGNLARARAIPDSLPALGEATCRRVVDACETTLVARFRGLPALGRTYVDPALGDHLVPFSQRSASRSLRTAVRGSKLPMPANCQTLRFFVWWKNNDYRTDVDLSAVLLDAEFGNKGELAYYNLKDFGGHHSGDIVDAPAGASEFIDLDPHQMKEAGVRYIIMVLNSYTLQPFCDLPECFAGWMARELPNSGEIYDPRTLQDRLDLTANSQIALPVAFDLLEWRAVWLDMALKRRPNFWNAATNAYGVGRWGNNVETNRAGIAITLQSLMNLNKPNLYDRLTLHAQARGEVVNSEEGAETVFSSRTDLPFRHEEIASKYLV